MLHLSDTHFDPYYTEGSNAACSEPLCCRSTDGIPSVATNGAGRWGDYRKCDTPRQTIESMLHHIANYHQVPPPPPPPPLSLSRKRAASRRNALFFFIFRHLVHDLSVPPSRGGDPRP